MPAQPVERIMSETLMPLVGWDRDGSPFHEGELSIQRRLGIAEKMDRAGRRSIRSFMPDQHRDFMAQLPFIMIGAVDRDGQPWASILTGRPGFLAPPDGRTLTIAANPLTGRSAGRGAGARRCGRPARYRVA